LFEDQQRTGDPGTTDMKVHYRTDATHRRSSLSKLGLLGVLTLSLASTGCSLVQGVSNYFAYNESCDDFVLGWRNEVWSNQAWHARRDLFSGHPQYYAFGEGFRDGYKDVASGGSGCPPTLAPNKFLSYRYQTAEGQAKVAAWFEGFPYGAEAARADLAGQYLSLPMSSVMGGQYSQEWGGGQCPNCREVHLAPAEGVHGEQVPAGPTLQVVPVPALQNPTSPAPAQSLDFGQWNPQRATQGSSVRHVAYQPSSSGELWPTITNQNK
jgi:hypothetical protein